MTWPAPLFWALAALFVAIAVLLVLYPLFRRRNAEDMTGRQAINIAVYRDQLQELERDRTSGLLSDEQYQTAKLELEARLAQDALLEVETAPASKGGRRLGYVLGGVIPAVAFGLYLVLGNPDAMLQSAVAQEAGMMGEHDIAAMVKSLEEKVKANPGDVQQQLLLARTYAAMERWPDALKVFEQASKMAPQEAAIWSGYAEALAMARQQKLQGKPMEYVNKALELNPDDPKGLELAGANAFEEQNFAQAAVYWNRLLKQLPPESAYAQGIAGAIRQAKSQAEASGGPPIDKLVPDDPRIAALTIRGNIEVAAKLKDKYPADATIFLFARSEGGGPPLAAIRARAGDLPLKFELNDSMAMNPQMKLSDQKAVTLTARISLSGQPAAASGDLEGTLTQVKVGSKDIKLVIDTVRP